METNYLEKVELYATRIITQEFSDKLVFHDIKYKHKVIAGINEIGKHEGLSDEELESVLMAGWFVTLGFKNLAQWGEVKSTKELFKHCDVCSQNETKYFLQQINYPEDKIDIIIDIITDASETKKPKTKLGKVLADATTIEWASKKAKKRLELRYQEFLLLEVYASNKNDFYSSVIEYLNEHKYHTAFGKSTLQPAKEKLIDKIEKEKKEIGKIEHQAIKRELNISDTELKRLKKNLKSVSGRDDRGIQTMLRTTSRNHYTLNQMVDRKANIMISVNAIIVSLILSRVIGTIDTFCIHNSPILMMLVSSVLSIIFSVIAITPSKSHGEFSEQDVREKKGNLLYFGNYHNMAFRDYEWGMLQMFNDSDYLYTSMTRDLYFLGQMLNRKYKFIRWSLIFFIVGFVISAISFLFVSSMSDFHLVGSHN